MVTGTLMIVVGIIVLLMVLGVNGKFLTMSKGFASVFAKKVATTSTGAQSVYEDAINKKQVSYAKANTAYAVAVGELKERENMIRNLKAKIAKKDVDIEALISAEKEEQATVLVEKLLEYKSELESIESELPILEKAVNDAKEINDTMREQLTALEKEQVQMVRKLELNEHMKEIYDGLDDAKVTNDTSKLIKSIKDKVKEGDIQIEGAKAIRESSTEVRLEKIEKEANKASASAYIEQMKAKMQEKK